jgi:uncharacterized membrane protein YhaH (DUF805 family)
MESENYWIAAWDNFAVFDGRARRMEYWLYRLEIMVVGVVFSLFYFAMASQISPQNLTDSGSLMYYLILIVVSILAILLVIVDLGVTVRRLHDTGKSGWWILIRMVPYIGGLVIFIFTVMDSEPGENQYGPNPKGNGIRKEIDQYLNPS